LIENKSDQNYANVKHARILTKLVQTCYVNPS